MYAVIRAGGKQYRVAPGDVIRVEKQAGAEGTVEFELLAVADDGQISRPQGEARVIGRIVGEGRGDKILVFHYKRKKQYKKLAGHRQPFTAVRIAEISYDGRTVKAPELPAEAAGEPKAAEGGAAPSEAVAPKRKSSAKKEKKSASSGTSGARSRKAGRSRGSSKKSGAGSKGRTPPKRGK